MSLFQRSLTERFHCITVCMYTCDQISVTLKHMYCYHRNHMTCSGKLNHCMALKDQCISENWSNNLVLISNSEPSIETEVITNYKVCCTE